MTSYTIFQKADEETISMILDWLRNQERGLYRAAINELSALKKLRPQYMSQKPLPEQFAWIKKMLSWKPSENIGDHLLQVWLVRKQEGMLIAFLNELGIEHNGHGMVEGDLPDSLDKEKLVPAVDALFAKNHHGVVSVYLQMFQNQTEKGWVELQEILDTHPSFMLR